MKTGLVISGMDALSPMGMGSDVGAYLLFEPTKIYDLVNLGTGFWGKKLNYDLGVFATTKVWPITLSTEYLQRAIAGTDSFMDYSSDKLTMKAINYAVTLRDLDLIASHDLGPAKLHAIGSYNWYDGYMLIDEAYQTVGQNFDYNLAKGYRAGIFATMLGPEIDSRMDISPRGIYLKAMYNYRRQYLLNEDNGIIIENGHWKENYDTYRYDDAALRIKGGITSPWYELHDFYYELNLTGTIPHQQILNSVLGKTDPVVQIPSYFKPAEWVQGYTYYSEIRRKSTKQNQFNEYDTITYDTVLITGNTVSSAIFSYRFPLWPKPIIDKKLGFLYFERLYGAINFASGAGFDSFTDMFKFKKENWLSSAGAEIRLQAQSFGLPLAVKFRWDRGFNRAAPIGGDHFTLGIGFSFDNWEYIDMPDYNIPVKTH